LPEELKYLALDLRIHQSKMSRMAGGLTAVLSHWSRIEAFIHTVGIRLVDDPW
jgi:hypothetical protein